MQDATKLTASIYLTESDKLLHNSGYNLAEEYFEILSHAELDINMPILELATGTGRMAAVLSRLGYDVITGDISAEDREKAEMRISKEYLSKIKFQVVNMESLPYGNASFSSVISMNTFHHLEYPEKCFTELIRVHTGKNSLIIGDFNQNGFAAMQKVYDVLYRQKHPRGSFDLKKVKNLLTFCYNNVKEIRTKLNRAYIASDKKTHN